MNRLSTMIVVLGLSLALVASAWAAEANPQAKAIARSRNSVARSSSMKRVQVSP